MRTFTYSMYIASAAEEDELAAGAVNWISLASFAPPLLMVALRSDSNLQRLVERTPMLVVNVTTCDQKLIAAAYFKPSLVVEDRINGLAFRRGSLSSAAILEDAWAWVEARVTEAVKRGDHVVPRRGGGCRHPCRRSAGSHHAGYGVDLPRIGHVNKRAADRRAGSTDSRGGILPRGSPLPALEHGRGRLTMTFPIKEG